MGKRWRIEMLGGLRAVQGETVVTRFRTQKTGSLLAYLAYKARPCPREVLCELLWPEADPEAARPSLCVALSSLRHQFEPPGIPRGSVLVADHFAVSVRPDAISTDTRDFLAALDTKADGPERAFRIAGALDLYRGELLHGYYDNWVIREQEFFADRFFAGAHWLVGYLEQAAEIERALHYAWQAVSVDTFVHEEAHRDLIRLLAGAGYTSDALRQLRSLESLLRERLQAEPAPETRALGREIERLAAESPLRNVPIQPLRPGTATAPLPAGMVSIALAIPADGQVSPEEKDLLLKVALLHGGRDAGLPDSGAVFPRTSDALSAATALQQRMAPAQSRLRVALHAGDVEVRAGRYSGRTLDEAAVLVRSAHPGQILCSEPFAVMARGALEPGWRARDLGVYRLRGDAAPERLFEVERRGEKHAFPPPLAERAYEDNLPLTLTRFIGRARDVQALVELVHCRGARLITLTGPGGSGKTRLAIEAARALLPSFPGRVCFVSLADVREAERIPDAVLSALGLLPSPQAEPLTQITEALHGEPSLFILDNYEHLVASGMAFIRDLLEQAPSLVLLVTTRRVLGVTGECEFRVRPLPVPSVTEEVARLSDCESVQLFVDRAQAVKPDFQLTPHNAVPIANLCLQLEGIPLAIELAAARAQALSPTQMLDQMAHRLDFLVNRKHDVASRHQTLRSAVDWSYRLLPPHLQRFLARLSVFRGGWTVEAAEAVCDEPLALDGLAELQDCSLVGTDESEDALRFRMLETLREYAAEALDAESDAEATHERFAAFYLGLARRCAERVRSPGEREAITAFKAELANTREATVWSLAAGRADLGGGLAVAVSGFLQRLGFLSEAAGYLTAALWLVEGQAEPDMRLQAGLLRETASLRIDQCDWGGARSAARRALSLFEVMGAIADQAGCCNLLGTIASGEGDAVEEQIRYGQALALFQQAADRVGTAIVLNNMALSAASQGRMDEAWRQMQQALQLRREAGDERGLSETLINLGALAHEAGRLDEARSYYEEGLSIQTALEDVAGMAVSFENLGEVAEIRLEREAATRFFLAARCLFERAASPQVHTAEAALQRVAGSPDLGALLASLRNRPVEEVVCFARDGEMEFPSC